MARRGNNGYYKKPGLESVRLPNEIKCNNCHKPKPPTAYSPKQQNELKAKIANTPNFDANVYEWVSCAECNRGGQKWEFKCFDCLVWKPRSNFAKTQLRGDWEKAKCKPCQQWRIDQEARGGSSDVDTGSGGDSDEASDDESDDGAATVPGTFSSLSINGYGTTSSSTTGGVPLGSSGGIHSYQQPAGTTITNTLNGSRATSTSVNGTAASSSTAAVVSEAPSYSTGAYGYGSSRGPGSVTSEKTTGMGRFAKVPAGPSRADSAVPALKTKVQKAKQEDDGLNIGVALDSDDESD